MADWFNDGVTRRVILRSATSLVGKAPTKAKRIKMMLTLPLTGDGESQVSNLPEWLEKARNFVMRNGETVTSAHVIREVNVTMGDENLFKKTPTEAPRSQLDHFQIKQMGGGDDPDTVLTFEIRTQFSTDLWNWCGQQSGEEFDAAFVVVGQEEGGDLTLTSDSEEDDEEDEDDASEDELADEQREALDPSNDREFDPNIVATMPPTPKPAKQPSEAQMLAAAKKNLQVM